MTNLAASNTVSWIHPSMRDVVIDHLMSRDADRAQFLRSIGYPAIMLAISSAGGASGDRSFPLLRRSEDWAIFLTRLDEVVPELEAARLSPLMAAVAAGLDGSVGERLDRLGTISERLLGAVRNSWDDRRVSISLKFLQQWYGLSRSLTYVMTGPDLTATWEDLFSGVSPARSVGVSPFYADRVLEFARLVRMCDDEEPRFLALADRRSRSEELLRDWLAEFEETVEELAELDPEETEEVEWRGEWYTCPVEPTEDEDDEREFLGLVMSLIRTVADIDQLAGVVSASFSDSVEEHLSVREDRRTAYGQSEEPDSGNDEDPGPSGQEFDLDDFFSDLV
jgi:hypothetical protein